MQVQRSNVLNNSKGVLADIRKWMSANMLKLNDEKTDFIIDIINMILLYVCSAHAQSVKVLDRAQ